MSGIFERAHRRTRGVFVFEKRDGPPALREGLAALPGHLLNDEIFSRLDGSDLATLSVVSRGMCDAVASSGRTWREASEPRDAARLGYIGMLRRLLRRGRLTLRGDLCIEIPSASAIRREGPPAAVSAESSASPASPAAEHAAQHQPSEQPGAACEGTSGGQSSRRRVVAFASVGLHIAG